jgi:NDP-sugar pyrophosphorylase family protein
MGKKITLFVLAAGMGSRYGGLKQMEGFGPSGETIIDYSIYDAIKAGFDRVVFVIRPDMEEAFKEVFLEKYEDRIDIDYCFQTVDMVPKWYDLNPERTKPWGTGHALLVAKDKIHNPFLVINGDDFYGRESFEIGANFLKNECDENTYAIPAYRLENVLSDAGTVKRGICTTKDKFLVKIEETFDIERGEEGSINGVTWDGKHMSNLANDTHISMNMFCLHPSVFTTLIRDFENFLTENKDELKGEYLLPIELSELIKKDEIRMKVLETPAQWFGITYKEDAQIVRNKLKKLVENGEYPEKLWD